MEPHHLAGQNAFVAQAQWSVTNSATTGDVTSAAPAFGRFTADGDRFDWTTINIGEIVELKVTELSMVSATGTTHQLGVLGLTTLTLVDGTNGSKTVLSSAFNWPNGIDIDDQDNLYVSDSSVFPTGPSLDPSMTIMGFSYVAAEAIARAL